MKRIIFFLLFVLLCSIGKGQNPAPGIFSFTITRDSICLSDSCVSLIMGDSLTNPEWVRAYVAANGAVPAGDSGDIMINDAGVFGTANQLTTFNLGATNFNAWLGSDALQAKVDGGFLSAYGYNSAMGLFALRFDTTGSWNSGFGAYSLYNNRNGTNNIGLGIRAGMYPGNLTPSLSNRLYINSLNRVNTLGDTTESIIYGYQDFDLNLQRLYLNANTFIRKNLTITDTLYTNEYVDFNGMLFQMAGWGFIYPKQDFNFSGSNLYELQFSEFSEITIGSDTDIRMTGAVDVQDSLRIGSGAWVDSSMTIDDAIENANPDSTNFGGHFIRFNESEGVHEFGTGVSEVIWQGALEDLVQVYNNTSSIITNGTPCYFSGSNGDTIATVGVASADSNAISFIGLATGDIAVNDWGYVATRGKVRNIPISGLSLMGALFLSDDSTLTNTKPAYPNEVVIIGGVIDATNGDVTVYVNPSLALKRQTKSKSYTFTSLGIGSGEYWKAGFYDASATDANLTQASLTITYGTADVSYEAHPFAVYGGVGSVTGGGRVALIVTGTSYSDVTGSQTPADVDTIINDITNAVLNAYDEAKKYLGTVTYSLVVVEGAPSAYSLDFNYGYAKYDDLNDKDFYIAAIEAVWIGDGTDATGFNIELYKHTQTGWTYAASGFDPGNGVLADRATDQAGFLRVLNGVESAWKRSRLNEYINGTGEEGYLIKVTTGANGTIQTLDIHVESALD